MQHCSGSDGTSKGISLHSAKLFNKQIILEKFASNLFQYKSMIPFHICPILFCHDSTNVAAYQVEYSQICGAALTSILCDLPCLFALLAILSCCLYLLSLGHIHIQHELMLCCDKEKRVFYFAIFNTPGCCKRGVTCNTKRSLL